MATVASASKGTVDPTRVTRWKERALHQADKLDPIATTHCPRSFLTGGVGLGGAAAFAPCRLSRRTESPPSCSESNLRWPCSADICRCRPLICSAARCCAAWSSWIVCWRLATASLSASSAARDGPALGRTAANGEYSDPIRLLAQSTAAMATARRRSRTHGSMRRGRPGPVPMRFWGVKSLIIRLLSRQCSIRSDHHEEVISVAVLACAFPSPARR